MDLKRITEALGLPVETSIEDVLAKLAEAKADSAALAGIYDSFSLSGEKRNPAEVRAKALAQHADFVPRSEFAALQAKLAESEVVDYVDGAVRLAKIAPADREFWLNAARKDLPAVKAHLGAKAAGTAVPLGVDAPPAKTEAAPLHAELTPAEQHMVATLGLKPESVIAARVKVPGLRAE